MRRQGKNAGGASGRARAGPDAAVRSPGGAAATASDQGGRRRANGGSTATVSSTTTVSQNDAAQLVGPWSHGTGLSIKQQQQKQKQKQQQREQEQHQYYPNGQFHIMSSSPLALTPSLSPLYKVPAPNYYASATTSSVANAAAATAAAFSKQSMDETIGRIFTTFLPGFFDALAKFQYHQVPATGPVHIHVYLLVIALVVLECEGKNEWRNWDAFSIMRRLAASCESTYHLMKYLEPDVLQSDAIDLMYSKLVVLMNHLAEEIKPMIARQHHFPMNGHYSHVHGVNASSSSGMEDPLADFATCGDLGYYAELLDQAAEFFSLRLPMIEMYRGLALATKPLDCNQLLKILDGLLVRFDAFDHPLLETMKQSAMEENRTVYAAMQTELRITQYDFTKSMIALHRLKKMLGSWSDHIDSLSDYPLFDEGGDVDDGDEGCDDDASDADENYGLSDSIYSNVSFSNQSMFAGESSSFVSRSNVRRTSVGLGSEYPGTDRSVIETESTTMIPRNPSIMSVESTTSVASDVHSTFSRLLSQSNLLKRGISGASVPIPVALRDLANIVQKPGDPYVSSGNSSVFTNTLEQAILGGGGSYIGGGGSVSGAAQIGGGGSYGDISMSAAEMIALSMKKQEREDGFALPVFQWAKRFYRSLVAKFSLYFHQWLEPLEHQGDFLSHDLTRFIRTPMGISYLQLMDVLLARGSYRGDDGSAFIMLILETEQLENKGAHYYQNGYLCPSTSRARPSQPEPEDQHQDSNSNSHDPADKMRRHSLLQQQPQQISAAPPKSPSVPQTNHSLFMQVDNEREEEQSDFSPLWGLRGWPAVFCYPNKEPPLQHWPNIVSLIMDNRDALETTRPMYEVHEFAAIN